MSGKNSGADKALNKNINEGAGEKGGLKRPSGAKRLKRGEPTERRIAEALIFLMRKHFLKFIPTAWVDFLSPRSNSFTDLDPSVITWDFPEPCAGSRG